MTCYDCVQEERKDTTAVGVCTHCGLATCQDHSRVLAVHVQQIYGMGLSMSRLAARRVVCRVCHTAETTR